MNKRELHNSTRQPVENKRARFAPKYLYEQTTGDPCCILSVRCQTSYSNQCVQWYCKTCFLMHCLLLATVKHGDKILMNIIPMLRKLPLATSGFSQALRGAVCDTSNCLETIICLNYRCQLQRHLDIDFQGKYYIYKMLHLK